MHRRIAIRLDQRPQLQHPLGDPLRVAAQLHALLLPFLLQTPGALRHIVQHLVELDPRGQRRIAGMQLCSSLTLARRGLLVGPLRVLTGCPLHHDGPEPIENPQGFRGVNAPVAPQPRIPQLSVVLKDSPRAIVAVALHHQPHGTTEAAPTPTERTKREASSFTGRGWILATLSGSSFPSSIARFISARREEASMARFQRLAMRATSSR